MAAPSVTLVGGLRAFDHTVVVEGETIQTLALYMEGDASHMTYCPSGESVFGGHAEKPTSLVDSSRSLTVYSSCLALTLQRGKTKLPSRKLFALQRASWLVNKPPLPHLFEDGVVERTLYTQDTALDKPIPFIFEWTTLLMGRCGSLLHNAGIYYGIWGSLFQYSCAWSPKTNTLVTCQVELSITLMDMDRIFGLPIAGQFYDEISPMVADFKEVRSTDLPFSCRYLFLAYHHLCRSSGSNVISSAAWVKFWFRTEDDAVPVDDPWAAWHARFGKDAPSFREFTATERDVFHFLHVTPGREDEVYLAALLSVWLSRFVFRAIGDEIRPMVFKVASYMATGVRFALAGPALACLYKGLGHAAAGWPSMAQWPYLYTWLAVYFHTHGEDLEPDLRDSSAIVKISPGDMGITANHREISSLSELVALWKTSIVRPCGRLDLPPSGERDPSRDPGTTPAYYTWWTTHMSSLFQQNRLESAPVVSAVEDSDEDYDSDRSHPRKRRPKGKRPVGASSASKKRAPLTILADASRFCVKEEEGTGLVAPQEEASVVGEFAEITPSEGLPVQEVAPSPSVVQEEAVIEAEALPPAVEEEDPTPAVEVPAFEAAVEVIQEEVPTTEGALETILAPEEAVIEVAPAAEEVSLVQATPPTSSSLTPSQTRRRSFCLILRA
ncbi:hypothetical protein H6P81_021380 [Aristolochia fimbriata]|uniref:Aminotransferase-like plant mobile domain-containing protein n=1 Tax=Aristolochia fimbriata TaxID=158543 RepID=A0AAV7DSN9_ARIFI|nr:hypothetical protein H6P81_021380 [Aristolochia fimbriata]